MKRAITVLGGAALAWACAAAPAAAYFVQIDTFTVDKNGGNILTDTFADGNPPPSTPIVSPAYGTNGTFAEAGGVATMQTATGSSVVFGGTNFIRHSATLLTNRQDVGVSTSGLKNDDLLSVTGVFKVSIPTNLRESYGVYFTENLPGTPGNDQVEMRLVRGQDGLLRLQLNHVDWTTQTSNGVGGIFLGAAVNNAVSHALDVVTNDTLTLMLANSANAMNVITGSWEYFDAEGGVGGTTYSGTIGNTATIFNGETWTRAGFFARVAKNIPEPASGALFVVGLAGLGFLRRRRKGA